MARNPKQDANLRPQSARTKSEQREIAKKGGKASGRSRAALKTFKEVLTDGLTKEEQEIMMKALKRNAMRGNLPCMEFLLKMMGQHPDQGGGEDKSVEIKIEGCDEYGD